MTHPIRFYLNGALQEVEGVRPVRTFLDWLRYRRRLTGTKEGCAEGDCGACTVALRDLDATGAVVTHPVNACILFMPMLDGKEIITVEGITGPAGEPHPVQTAMVAAHASQCGFCTPGFVMSLWCAMQNGLGSEADLETVLAGNLCRCTGYRPIIDAARQALAAGLPDWERNDTPAARLGAIRREGDFHYEAKGDDFTAPATPRAMDQALAKNPAATILSGGTDIGLWVTKQRRRLPRLISTGRIEGAGEITVADNAITLGAGVRYTEAMDVFEAHIPELARLLRRIGGAQVRAMGTICGNIANGSPIGDMPPALMALGATVTLRKAGARRKMPLEAFFIDYGKQDREPGEWLESVRIPIPAPKDFRVYKISKRFDQDISALCGAFQIKLADGMVQDARIAYGGMAATPKRATAMETALIGKAWTPETIAESMAALTEDFTPISDMRASAAYRKAAGRNLLLRFYLDQTGVDATRLETLETAP